MNLALSSFFIISIVFATLFVLGKEVIFKFKNNPNLTAFYAVVLGVLFVFYFFAIFGIAILSVVTHKFLPLSLLLFVYLTFVIGKKVTYKTLTLYSNLQVLLFLASSILTLIFLKLY